MSPTKASKVGRSLAYWDPWSNQIVLMGLSTARPELIDPHELEEYLTEHTDKLQTKLVYHDKGENKIFEWPFALTLSEYAETVTAYQLASDVELFLQHKTQTQWQ